MQAIRKILKYPFTKLYAFGTFALDAKSRRWPGLSRFSIWILLTTLLLSIAQVTLHLWLAITLARMPLEASGCYEGHSISGFPELNEKVLRPVTYADIRNQDAISVGGRPSLGAIVTAAWVPFCVLIMLGFAIATHFSRRGMSNRHAAFSGFLLILGLTGVAAAGLCLNVDMNEVLTDVNWCWVDHARMRGLSAERGVRCRVRNAIGVVLGVQVACVLLYIFAAIHAARLNARRIRRQSEAARFQDLDPEAIRMERAARLNAVVPRPHHVDSPPHGIEIDGEADDGVLRNPFENPENVVGTSEECGREAEIFRPPSHQFADVNTTVTDATKHDNNTPPSSVPSPVPQPSPNDTGSTPILDRYIITLHPHTNVSAHRGWLDSLSSSPKTWSFGDSYSYAGEFDGETTQKIKERDDVANVEPERVVRLDLRFSTVPDATSRCAGGDDGGGSLSRGGTGDGELRSGAVDELSVIEEEGSDEKDDGQETIDPVETGNENEEVAQEHAEEGHSEEAVNPFMDDHGMDEDAEEEVEVASEEDADEEVVGANTEDDRE